MNKALRQRAILDVLRQEAVASQEALQRALRKRGFKVGQATLSRDMRDLNLSKTATGYTLPQGEGAAGPAFPPRPRRGAGVGRGVGAAQNIPGGENTRAS